MEQINTGMFYTLGKQLQDVFIHARFQIKFWNIGAQTLKQALDALVQGSSSGPYRADESNTSARVLSEELGRVLEVHKADGEAKLSDDQVSRLNSAVFGFDQAVALELGRAPIFYCDREGRLRHKAPDTRCQGHLPRVRGSSSEGRDRRHE